MHPPRPENEAEVLIFPSRPKSVCTAKQNIKKRKKEEEREESTTSKQKPSFEAERILPILKACLLGKALNDFICCEVWNVRAQPANRQSETAFEASSVHQTALPQTRYAHSNSVMQWLCRGLLLGGKQEHFTDLFPISTEDLALAQSSGDG